MALLFSPPIFIPKNSFPLLSTNRFSLLSTNRFSLLSVTRANSSDTGITSPATVSVDVKEPPPTSTPVVKKEKISTMEGHEEMKTTETLIKFEDARWVNGTWDLKQFEKDGKTDWDDVIVAVLFIRKNEDVDKLKKLFDETTLYDKQWQAAWKDGEDDSSSSLSSKK